MTSQTTTKWWTLGVVSVATFMLLLDITVVNTALPAIEEDLNATFTDLQWVVDAYTLTLAAVVLTAGVLADRLGRRRVFAIGLGIFSIASLVAGLASDPTFLNIARGAQGVGGAVMFAVSLALIAQEFPAGRERGLAMGVYGATIGLAVAFGPLVGGLIVDSLGWEWIFFLNVPIGVAAIAISYLRVRESRDPNATGVDWPGLITFSSALFALVLALIRGNEDGWGSTFIVGLLAASAVLLAAFIAIERRVAEPMLPLGLFKRPAFTGVQLAAFGISGSMFALFLGHSPTEAGLRYLPLTVAVFLVAPIAGALLSKVHARVMISLGLLGAGGGLLLMAGVGAADEWTGLLGGFIVAGAGIGLLNPVIADVAVSVVPKEQSGMASGINDTFRQVGVSVGVAVWGAIFLGAGSSKVEELTGLGADRSRGLVEAVSSGNLDQALTQVPAGSRAQVADAAREGFLAGFNDIAVYGAVLAFAAAIAAFFLVRERDIERGELEVIEAVEDEGQPSPTAVPEPVAA
jgi:EmrB/QacA subfamily drug resistance transporter